jgi:hypothetical protein
MVGTIWTSRRFWLAVVDVVGSLTLYFVIKYLNPSAADDVKMVLAGLQPLIITLVISYTVEDNAAIKAGVHPKYSLAEPEKPKWDL